jgi:hypothetical protein
MAEMTRWLRREEAARSRGAVLVFEERISCFRCAVKDNVT